MYKLFEFFSKNIKFEDMENYILEISPMVYLFEYETEKYEVFLKKMSKYDCKQFIFTSELFYKLIEKCQNKEIKIKEIKISDHFENEFNEEINMLLLDIYSYSEVSLKKILNRLKLFEESNGIEIEYVYLSLKENGRTKKIKIYNSGIISSNLSVDNLKTFLKFYLSEVI